jgi:hypothetical protein
MRKILHFDSPRETYRCDAAVLWCFDARFELPLRKLLKRLGLVHADIIRVAGGAKCLAAPEAEPERDFVLEQIRKSIHLHGTTRVLLMLHSDCGAYGGLEAYGGNVRAETQHHEEHLRRAARALGAHNPELTIECYFVDFEGIWSVENAAAGLIPA